MLCNYLYGPDWFIPFSFSFSIFDCLKPLWSSISHVFSFLTSPKFSMSSPIPKPSFGAPHNVSLGTDPSLSLRCSREQLLWFTSVGWCSLWTWQGLISSLKLFGCPSFTIIMLWASLCVWRLAFYFTDWQIPAFRQNFLVTWVDPSLSLRHISSVILVTRRALGWVSPFPSFPWRMSGSDLSSKCW